MSDSQPKSPTRPLQERIRRVMDFSQINTIIVAFLSVLGGVFGIVKLDDMTWRGRIRKDLGTILQAHEALGDSKEFKQLRETMVGDIDKIRKKKSQQRSSVDTLIDLLIIFIYITIVGLLLMSWNESFANRFLDALRSSVGFVLFTSCGIVSMCIMLFLFFICIKQGWRWLRNKMPSRFNKSPYPATPGDSDHKPNQLPGNNKKRG